eukprot:GSA25T00020253001.1
MNGEQRVLAASTFNEQDNASALTTDNRVLRTTLPILRALNGDGSIIEEMRKFASWETET